MASLTKSNGRAQCAPARSGRSGVRLVAVVVAMAMAPGPILLLLVGRRFAEVAILIVVVFVSPLVIVDNLIVVPHVVVAVIRIIDAVVMRVTATHDQRGR